MTVTNDTLVPGPHGKPQLIPSPRWRELYNSNIAVRLAYDQAKYGTGGPPPTITPPPRPEDLDAYDPAKHQPATTPRVWEFREPITTTFRDITPVPQQHREPMDRATLIAAARGEARTLDVKDEYIAWLMEQLADALEAAVDPDDATNLED